MVVLIFSSGKCALDHPHHVLPKMFGLANAFMDENYADSKPASISSSPRTDACKVMLQELRKETKLRSMIDQWELMSSGKLDTEQMLKAQAHFPF